MEKGPKMSDDESQSILEVDGSHVMQETRSCPWCAEQILTAARKCKHCGEYLTEASNPADAPASMGQSTQYKERSNELAKQLTDAQTSTPPATASTPQATQVKPVWKFASGNAFTQAWKCITHGKTICTTCSKLAKRPTGNAKPGQIFPDPAKPPVYTGKIGTREQISAVGAKTDAGLACPKCGGSQFTAKRSKKGKVIGFATIGVGGLVAPKSQVKCVTCGTMFKRG
jgi:hypothetical protein